MTSVIPGRTRDICFVKSATLALGPKESALCTQTASFHGPKFPLHLYQKILLSWPRTGTHIASLAGPIDSLSFLTHNPLSWTQIPPSFGRKQSPVLDSHWDSYCVPNRTQIASFLYLTQPFVKDPNLLLFWTKTVFCLRLTLEPILRPLQYPNSLLSWTYI